MNNKNQIRLVEDSETPSEYSNILDTIKDATKIFDKSEYHLDGNIPWAKQPNDKWQAFITRQKLVAMSFKNSFPPIRLIDRDEKGNPVKDEYGHYMYVERTNPFAKKCHDLIMTPVYSWAIMNRNTKENPMLMGILNFGQGQGNLNDLIIDSEDNKDNKIMKAVKGFFKKNKEKEKVIIGGD